MNMEIAVVKTFCDFGHKFSKKQQFWWFFMRNLAISYKKNLATLHQYTVAQVPLLVPVFFHEI